MRQPDLVKTGHHRGSRAYTELGKNPSEMGADGPRADAQDVGDHLVRVTHRHHANDFVLAWTQLNSRLRRRGQPDQEISRPVDIDVQDNFLFDGVIITQRCN
jgi:hypothetical protein